MLLHSHIYVRCLIKLDSNGQENKTTNLLFFKKSMRLTPFFAYSVMIILVH